MRGSHVRAAGCEFRPTDLRGEYAVGDKAVNYYTAGGESESPE